MEKFGTIHYLSHFFSKTNPSLPPPQREANHISICEYSWANHSQSGDCLKLFIEPEGSKAQSKS